MKPLNFLLSVLFSFCIINGYSQSTPLWHNQQREIHYAPEGRNFKKVNGTRRFNRALYGGNSGFRAEAGDLPEFALYLPGMGGNIKFGLISGDQSKWLINADSIYTWYRPGSMYYVIKDSLLKNGMIRINATSLYDREGLILRVEWNKVPENVKLIAVYGGATGTRFSREGDIGADPESSFYLKPEYCRNNAFRIKENAFTLFYGAKTMTEEERYEIQHLPNQTKDTARQAIPQKMTSGVFPEFASLRISDAAMQDSPLQFSTASSSGTPALCGTIKLQTLVSAYFLVMNGTTDPQIKYSQLPGIFAKAEKDRKALAERINVNTPDPYINTIGGTLSIAGDAIWESPSYMHGAVAWRMRLNGWRGAYVADVFGWHDRARTHFNSYALSQLTIQPGPVVMDTALHLARSLEKLGTSLYSDGYICRNPNGDFRPHHYDMNLVFIDQLLNHFQWTGDTGYIKKMWPLLTRHLAWEKRNFDSDGDGLYDAYAAIWASDAMQYSGGGVAHTSAYNYRGNVMAAELARLIGKDPSAYDQEAKKILKAMNRDLWLRTKGSYAEYKDILGNRLTHPAAGLWTIYHSIDSKVPDPFQAYQLLRYVDNEIPHIPIRANGLADTSLYTISTTNWQPYDWSLNNVVLGEILHTALAYWQGGRPEEAYKLWKSALVESMYLGASPGNIQQLSFYDAIRGELYRDFADDIGMAARSLVEGLFGIRPDALNDTLYVSPGFPANWKYASINTPDIDFSFAFKNNITIYDIIPRFLKRMNLVIRSRAPLDHLESVFVNGKKAEWAAEKNAIGFPIIRIVLPPDDSFHIEINWKGNQLATSIQPGNLVAGQAFKLNTGRAVINNVYDPQKALQSFARANSQLTGTIVNQPAHKTFFLEVKQGNLSYWLPVSAVVKNPVDISFTAKNILLGNNSSSPVSGRLYLNNKYKGLVLLQPGRTEAIFKASELAGTNTILFQTSETVTTSTYVDWDRNNPASSNYEKVDISGYFNDQITSIFKNQYLSPRPKGPTLQLPTQGIGNWAYPLITAVINDSGLKKRAENNNEIVIKQGIPFSIDPENGKKNIVFTSQWDNFPDSLFIPLTGKASHAYFLMAGTTNPMQSRMTNGEVIIHYRDGSNDRLELRNPETWWPIEQDYFEDGFAFTTGAPKPVRVYLKTGEDNRSFSDFTTIRGYSNRAIDGGAATVLDLPLNPVKELQSLELKTVANDVLIGLMSLTMLRDLK